MGRDDGGRGRQDVAVLVVLNGLVDHDWKHGVPGQAEGFEFIRIRAACCDLSFDARASGNHWCRGVLSSATDGGVDAGLLCGPRPALPAGPP
jgi:hypothetical protein